jgi:hypothetical protein
MPGARSERTSTLTCSATPWRGPSWAGLKTAQEILGHRHVGTTAETYAGVDEPAMVEAVAAAERLLGSPSPAPSELPSGAGPECVFAYDAAALEELERLVEQNGLGPARRGLEEDDGGGGGAWRTR